MASPAELVTQTFTNADTYARDAKTEAASFLQALSGSLFTAPTISVSWSTMAPPSIEALPDVPDLPTVVFNAPTGVPTTLTEVLGDITIDSFDEAAPTLDLPTAPTVSYGLAPTVPSVNDVAVPDAPTIDSVALPTMMSINTVSFAGVNLREEWLDKLTDIPVLDLVAPTPYSYTPSPQYGSALLDALKNKIAERLNGGTGLPPAVEQAIWDRARDRESAIAQANVDEIQRQSEALGYQLPAGTMVAQMREAQQKYYDKLSELSRDVAIKQAELEQTNIKNAIDEGFKLEAQLIDYSYKLEQLTFEASKAYADNAIQVYNAGVEGFKALLDGYRTYASTYKTIIDAELAKVEVYKAQLSAEETKAQINNSLVQQYKAQIEASMSRVEIYKAQVGAAQTLIQLEQAKVGAAGEQIRAYVAQVNAETAKIEAYKAQVQAEATKVDVYRTKAQAFSAKTGAQAEKARAEISRFQALAQAKAAEWDGYKVKVATEGERIRALGLQSGALLDGYKAAAAAVEAKAGMQTKIWETQIREYEAKQNITLQTAKVNNDAMQWANQARLDAAKTGAQIYAQLTASAYSMIHAQAGIQGSGSTTVNYSYSNDTTTTVPPLTAI